MARTPTPTTAHAETPVLPVLTQSKMFAKFLADVDEYDIDEYRTIEDTPEGPVIRLSDTAFWHFAGWCCLKYGALPYLMDWEEVASLVLESPEPFLLPCGCFEVLPVPDDHAAECPVTFDYPEEWDIAIDNWKRRYLAKQDGPAALAAEIIVQHQQSLDAFLALVTRFFLAHPALAPTLQWEGDTCTDWPQPCWLAFTAWAKSQDTVQAGPRMRRIEQSVARSLMYHLDLMQRSPELQARTFQRLRQALNCL
jgi:hypothetical protein